MILDDAANDAAIGRAYFRGLVALAQAGVGIEDGLLQLRHVLFFADAAKIRAEPAALCAEHVAVAATGAAEKQLAAGARIALDLLLRSGAAQRAQPDHDGAGFILRHRER